MYIFKTLWPFLSVLLVFNYFLKINILQTTSLEFSTNNIFFTFSLNYLLITVTVILKF